MNPNFEFAKRLKQKDYMSKVGTKIFCPSCKSFSVCKAISPRILGKPKAQRWHRTDYTDIAWFRRARECLSCSYKFLTAEVDERLIEEIIRQRSLLSRRHTALVKKIRKQTSWLKRSESIPIELAERFIEASAWWLSHSSGDAIRAPGHAERIYMLDGHGWAVDFGANTFLVGKAIERCRYVINEHLDEVSRGKFLVLPNIINALKLQISGAVANIEGYEYAGCYPIQVDDLVFGTQTIDVKDAANFMLKEADIIELLGEERILRE